MNVTFIMILCYLSSIDCIERRYGEKFDYRALVMSLKQKCRDAKPEQ